MASDSSDAPRAPATWLDLSRAHLEAVCDELAVPRVHARTLMRNTHRLLGERPWEERSIPARLAAELSRRFPLVTPALGAERHSEHDGSLKLLIETSPDPHTPASEVEAVLIPEAARVTLCVSSQIGCGEGCVFCHTGRMGLVRDLSAGEIVSQLVAANRWLAAHPGWLTTRGFAVQQRVTNLVFMGMGEPLDNVHAVSDAIAIVTDPAGAAVPLRRITVSTAGALDGLELLLERWPTIPLALSLHATDEATRAGLMPITTRFPLADVTARLARASREQRQPIFVQYTLFAGVNDSRAHAEDLAAWCRAIPELKVNLIPFNAFPGSRLRAPADPTVAAFRDVLHRAGLRVMRRHSKGPDIAAACGQLAFR